MWAFGPSPLVLPEQSSGLLPGELLQHSPFLYGVFLGLYFAVRARQGYVAMLGREFHRFEVGGGDGRDWGWSG